MVQFWHNLQTISLRLLCCSVCAVMVQIRNSFFDRPCALKSLIKAAKTSELIGKQTGELWRLIAGETKARCQVYGSKDYQEIQSWHRTENKSIFIGNWAAESERHLRSMNAETWPDSRIDWQSLEIRNFEVESFKWKEVRICLEESDQSFLYFHHFKHVN